jgi:flagellar hook assembly protein FlgD
VKSLGDEVRGAGEHTVVWDGTDAQGDRVAKGVYVCQLDARGFTRSRKIVILE